MKVSFSDCVCRRMSTICSCRPESGRTGNFSRRATDWALGTDEEHVRSVTAQRPRTLLHARHAYMRMTQVPMTVATRVAMHTLDEWGHPRDPKNSPTPEN